MKIAFSMLAFIFAIILVLIPSCARVVVEDVCPPLLSSPIYASAEVSRLKSLYWAPIDGSTERHRGIDIVFADKARVRATAPGKVTQISDSVLAYGPIKGVTVKYNNRYSVYYVFESAEALSVSVGSQVAEGDIIGTLAVTNKAGTMEAWLHFEVDWGNDSQCPIMFFNTATRSQFEVLYNLHPTAGLVDPCYLHPAGCPSLH